MARILEAYRQPVPSVPPSPVAVAAAAEATITPSSALSEPATSEAMPFIEVGGPSLEGSDDVLAGRAEPSSPPPAPATDPAKLDPQAPTDVAFEPVSELTLAATHERFSAELVAFHQPEHRLSQEYDVLLDSILQQTPAGTSAVFLFHGVTDSGETTTAVLNLALTLARRDQRVAVVDANLHAPAVDKRLGMGSAPGLMEVCGGEIALGRALRESGQANLCVLTAGDAAPALPVRSLPAILGQLRRRVDYIFVDAPAWRGGPEQLNLAKECEALFLVVPRDRYRTAQVKELLQGMSRQGVPLRGCVLTQKQ
jgi:Mrp family chromosome partitioning ATPase